MLFQVCGRVSHAGFLPVLLSGSSDSIVFLVFTKCKESLQDGRRLENISWRMWHREMVVAQSYRPPTPESSSPTVTESRKDFPFYTPAEQKSIHRDGEQIHL